MKRTLLNLMAVCALIFAVTLTSCKKDKAETPTQSQSDKLVGKWIWNNTMANITMQGTTQKDTINYTGGQYYQFNANGTVDIGSTLTTGSASWKIVNNKLQIYTADKLSPGDGYDISTLTGTTLQLHYIQADAGSTVEAWLNFTKAK
jgi:hypothetical protein